MLDVITHDTDSNGRLDLQSTPLTLGARVCWPERHMHYQMGQNDWSNGDTPQRFLASRHGGSARQIPDLIFPVGDRLLLRRPDASIVAEDVNGASEEWVPAECRGTILGYSTTLRRTLVMCHPRGGHGLNRVEIHGPDIHHVLTDFLRFEDAWRDTAFAHGRLATYSVGKQEYVLDMVELRQWPVPAGHSVVLLDDTQALLIADGRWQRWNPVTGLRVPLPNFPFDRPFPSALAWSRDGRILQPLSDPLPVIREMPTERAEPPAAEKLQAFIDAYSRRDGAFPYDPLPIGPLAWRRPKVSNATAIP